ARSALRRSGAGEAVEACARCFMMAMSVAIDSTSLTVCVERMTSFPAPRSERRLRKRTRNLLSDLGAGKLVILSTHIVSDVESIATDIAIMKHRAHASTASPAPLLRSAERA